MSNKSHKDRLNKKAIMTRYYNGFKIRQRHDGWICASDMCQLSIDDDKREMLTFYCSSGGDSLDYLIALEESGFDNTVECDDRGNTWIHPLVAIDFGRWFEPKFYVEIDKWVIPYISYT